ncbi:hypothetical protein [Gordonia crocea]|nr:hypothetical protein [Gordonia crocea]
MAQLLSPLESKARVDRYRARYQGRSGAGVSRLPARNDVAVERDAA